MSVRRKYIRHVVERLLSALGVTEAPVDVDIIVKQMGLQLDYSDVSDDSLSGFLLRSGNDSLIAVNSRHHSNRQRFTVAHELGHYVLHANASLHVNKGQTGVQIKLRSERHEQTEEESEANAFAAELLMPAPFIKHDLQATLRSGSMDEDIIESLAKSYRVSVQAMTFRLANLGYIEL